jgi:hypothetical protein
LWMHSTLRIRRASLEVRSHPTTSILTVVRLHAVAQA